MFLARSFLRSESRGAMWGCRNNQYSKTKDITPWSILEETLWRRSVNGSLGGSAYTKDVQSWPVRIALVNRIAAVERRDLNDGETRESLNAKTSQREDMQTEST
jgi:hypothetical protein